MHAAAGRLRRGGGEGGAARRRLGPPAGAALLPRARGRQHRGRVRGHEPKQAQRGGGREAPRGARGGAAPGRWRGRVRGKLPARGGGAAGPGQRHPACAESSACVLQHPRLRAARAVAGPAGGGRSGAGHERADEHNGNGRPPAGQGGRACRGHGGWVPGRYGHPSGSSGAPAHGCRPGGGPGPAGRSAGLSDRAPGHVLLLQQAACPHRQRSSLRGAQRGLPEPGRLRDGGRVQPGAVGAPVPCPGPAGAGRRPSVFYQGRTGAQPCRPAGGAGALFRTRTTEEWVATLEAADILCAPLLSYPELVDAQPTTRVRMFNRNTRKVLVAEVPVRDDAPRVEGGCRIEGVPGRRGGGGAGLCANGGRHHGPAAAHGPGAGRGVGGCPSWGGQYP